MGQHIETDFSHRLKLQTKKISYHKFLIEDYTRPLKPELVETSLDQLINETLSTITVPENVKISIELEKGFKLIVEPQLMRRVFTNLITNPLQTMIN